MKTWHKIAVTAGVVIVIVVVMVFILNVKMVRITEDYTVRVWFGRMDEGKAADVLAAADGLFDEKKYAFARDAYNVVIKYHEGDKRDDALLGVARTYIAEGDDETGFEYFERIIAEHPKGDVVENHLIEGHVAAELDRVMKAKPLDYLAMIRFAGILDEGKCPKAPDYTARAEAILNAPINLSAEFAHEKELVYTVKRTAAEDARKEALFHAKAELPGKILAMLKKRVDFGSVVADETLLEIITDNMTYGDRLAGLERAGTGGTTSSGGDEYADLPEEWADVLKEASVEEGWSASAVVVGTFSGITLRDILVQAGVNPMTGEKGE
ncbi:MAG: hypothetical protein JSW52_08435 [Candidatus Coatesbacteria bacterium]|nr:MAG: hypothetical protein JSW52_08435 [Candidatus Coatesbacteria bacterium]